ncbi:MAG: M23 family metallopeptidase [Oceanicaulis sp.]
MRAPLALIVLVTLALAACASPPAPRLDAPRGPVISHDAPPGFEPLASLRICPQPAPPSRPASGADGRILAYQPVVRINGVPLLKAPARDVCLYRGVGFGRGAHEGLDLAPFPRDRIGPIFAAGDGVVIETGDRHDFGLWVLIDHGRGVYTRYAHLSSIAPGVRAGAYVTQGVELGVMGGTGGVPVHLHYAILTGRYDTPARSFGLDPVDPFGLELAGLGS